VARADRGPLADGHRVGFFERDVEYYAQNRDLHALPEGGELVLYRDWAEALPRARRALAEADAGIVTSYCPDALAATELVLGSRAAVRCFYDLDTPVTLARLAAGEPVGYVGPEGLGGFDLVLSYTGGGALDALRDRLGARRVAPLYGSVEPALHHPAPPEPRYESALSYLGTYADDRQAVLERLFVEPARRRPGSRFVIGGAQYPPDFPWTDNIWFVRHLPPAEHPAFYAASRLTLNVTREAMARSGWCPSGRLFEAASCGVPILSDWFDGLDAFFEPGREILIARGTEDALAALDMPDAELAAVARRARSGAWPSTPRSGARARWWRRLNPRPRRSAEIDGHVGHRAGGGAGDAHPAARLLQGAAARGQPRGRERRGAPARRQRALGRAHGARRRDEDPVRHLAAEVRHPALLRRLLRPREPRLRGAGARGGAVRRHLPRRALRAAGRTRAGRPAGHHLVPRGRAA
jgi:spore maturation protein CgeB